MHVEKKKEISLEMSIFSYSTYSNVSQISSFPVTCFVSSGHAFYILGLFFFSLSI
jgi:hypothetical protein